MRRRQEGSASDGSDCSLEEIPADNFRVNPSSRSRVWMGYPAISRSFSQDLYSFAWAQAVQNKPLGFDVKKEDEELVYEIDDDDHEEEEGELEEGEIELGSEPLARTEPEKDPASAKNESEKELVDEEMVIGEFDQRVGVILEELDTITEEETDADFEGVCLRLQKSFASLKQMFCENPGVPVLGALVEQAFMGIKTVYSVYSSGNLNKLNQDRELLLRLLIHIKNQYSVFLTPEQVKEIDERVQSLASESVIVDKSANVGYLNDFGNSVGLCKGVNNVSANNGRAAFLRKLEFGPLLNLHAEYDEDSLPSPTRNDAPPFKPIGFGAAISAPPPQVIAPKNAQAENGTFHPFSDDAFKEVSFYQKKNMRTSNLPSNRLPSPTPSDDGNDGGGDDSHNEVSSSSVGGNVRNVGSSSANTNSLSGSQFTPMKPVVQMGMGHNPSPVMKPPSKSRDPRLRFMNSEAAGAMNSRKQKAGDEPSLDGNSLKRQRNEPSGDLQVTTGSGGGWIGESGMMTSHMGNRVRPNETVPIDTRIPGYRANTNINPNGSNFGSVPNPASSSHTVTVPSYSYRANTNINPNGSNVGSVLNPASSTTPTVTLPSYPSGLNAGSVPYPATVTAPAVSQHSYPNGSNVSVVPNPATSSAPTVSLPSLLKDIAVNPTMLLQLVKMEQQRLAAEAQQKAANPKSVADTQLKGANLVVNGMPGTVPFVNHNLAKSSAEVGQNPVAKSQMPPQAISTNAQNDVGRIRMKPRDPRRVLHTNVVTKTSGALVSDTQNIKDSLTVRGQGEQAQTTSLLSQSAPLPDIARQFTKNLKNVADIVTTSQLPDPKPSGSQSISQPMPSKISDDSNEPKTLSGLSSQGGSTVAPSVNPWEGMDHLLDGYDEQQKAAIQKERARRIAEQNKMFAERKLCLVLDLDHTLLNSAKFIEVDPVHEEILRKKEEQDREKPERHLFRFQHMGMWTKLRPGIWNFLDKASKLFELHLYTMGNKVYATEMAKVLDPTGALFAGRVISRGDDGDPFDGDERVPKSKDLEGVLGMESAVVIIDDSVRVWPHNKLNLIVVERYTYFPCSRRQFGLPGPSLLEIDHDERPEEGTLASSLTVIERLHGNFFSHQSLNEVDVRSILASEQRKILAGCKIVFSRVFPVGEANPHLHPLWQTAEQFGAECTNQIDEHVTHVVANSRGTDKVNWALSTGRSVVHPGWICLSRETLNPELTLPEMTKMPLVSGVEASALLYRRASEQDFAVKI